MTKSRVINSQKTNVSTCKVYEKIRAIRPQSCVTLNNKGFKEFINLLIQR